MKKKQQIIIQSALLILTLLISATTTAANFSVGPVRLSLPIGSPSTSVELRSGEFKTPIILQATAYRWEQEDNQRVLTESNELTLSPSVVLLNPGDVKTLVVRAKDTTVTDPRYYRLLIEEVSNEVDRANSSQVNFRKTFDLPVFIENTQAPELLASKIITADKSVEWQAEIVNTGQRHIALSKVEIAVKNKVLGSADKLTYVLPGSSVQVNIPLERPDSGLTETSTPTLRFYNMKSELIAPTAE